jgi:hypothetical protein
MGKTPTPAHRASAQLHNALRDALACVCASWHGCSSRSWCCVRVLAGLYLGWVVAPLVGFSVPFSYLTCDVFVVVREALCCVCLCGYGYARSRELRILRRSGHFFTLGTLHALKDFTTRWRQGSDRGHEDNALPPLHSHTNSRKHSRRQKNCYAGDVAIVDNHTAVTHASFLVT